MRRRHTCPSRRWRRASPRLLAKWRNPRHKATRPVPTVPSVQLIDPATGRLISPIVAAAPCIKPRGLLTANQAAKVDALKRGWPEFAAMRQLAMRFWGVLKSKSVNCAGVWTNGVQRSDLYAMQRFCPRIANGHQRHAECDHIALEQRPNGRTDQSPKSSQTNDVWPDRARTSPRAHIAFVAAGVK